MSPTFTDDDIGKSLESADGDRLGVVVDIDRETAYVEPTPDAADATRAVLDWDESATEAVPVTDDAVTEIGDDAIRLEGAFDAESVTAGSTGDRSAVDEDQRETVGGDDDDVQRAAGEPVASNPTETAVDADASRDEPGTGGLEDAEPLMEDSGYYDTGEGDARVDPADGMKPPESESDSDSTPGSETDAESDAGLEESVDAQESTDRADVDVDPADVTDGDPEAEIGSEADVGRRDGPE
ncbi:hypothetical protein [Natronolimnohabitans innermongolicus]|uniref:Uncharacterized protein n=1 Tax=Natronolimnohabitans innermongolicus JCM 12255 TaxID=1227499 RepID=L9X2Q4_9EURY|nr:hypothetical protein [Natronolimnohabitans innermongolicus]ELY55761.1 hypothetical protein C493_10862 [Natronolimnohabitans innermongolicus JCM 12255]